MTYRELIIKLIWLSDEQLDQTAVVLDSLEGTFHAVKFLGVTREDGIYSHEGIEPGKVYIE